MKNLPTLSYDVSSAGVEGQICQVSAIGFDETILSLKKAIFDADLWLIQELDPQTVMLKGGFSIGRARQLLVFHARYLEKLLQGDSSALPEAPLKIIVLENKDGGAVVRALDPAKQFSRYPGLQSLGDELSKIVKGIVGAVA